MYLKVETSDAASKLSELLKDGDWMVLYYAEWCGHCKAMKPEWDKVVERLKENKKINVADVKSDVIDELSHKPKIEGFPTIKMYNKGTEVAKFEDVRSADKLEQFAVSNTTSSNTSELKNTIKVNLDELPSAPQPIQLDKNSNAVKKLSVSELKNEIATNHRKTNKKSHKTPSKKLNTTKHNIVELEQNNANKHMSQMPVENMNNLGMLLQPPALNIKEKKPTKQQKTKMPVLPPSQETLLCSDIRTAKKCKNNAKCFYDYKDYKCKNKFEHPINTNNKNKQPVKSNVRPKTNKNKTNNIKEVLQTLKNSFNKIGNEAKKDSNLLTRASKQFL